VGWDSRYCGHSWSIVLASGDSKDDCGKCLWLWGNWWNEYWQGKPKYSEKNCPSATFVYHKIPHDQTRVWTRAVVPPLDATLRNCTVVSVRCCCFCMRFYTPFLRDNAGMIMFYKIQRFITDNTVMVQGLLFHYSKGNIARWSSGKVQDLYSGGAWSPCPSGHWLSWLRFSLFSSVCLNNIPG
jgi:hypothetical protein